MFKLKHSTKMTLELEFLFKIIFPKVIPDINTVDLDHVREGAFSLLLFSTGIAQWNSVIIGENKSNPHSGT